jgi:hypothetical protein
VVDAETGMTAADQLSHVVTKAKKNAKQIGQTMAAIFLVMAVGLGFWNFNPAPTLQQLTQPATKPALPTSVTPMTPKSQPVKPVSKSTPTKPNQSITSQVAGFNIDSGMLRSTEVKADYVIPGTDMKGLPLGFQVFDSLGNAGLATVSTESSDVTLQGEVVTTTDFITVRDGVNVMLHQTLVWKNGVLSYSAEPMVRINGAWVDIPVASKAVDREVLANGDVVITANMLVDATKVSTIIDGPGMGVDAQRLPAVILVRLHTSPSGMPVYGQVVQVIDPLQGSSS